MNAHVLARLLGAGMAATLATFAAGPVAQDGKAGVAKGTAGNIDPYDF
jgi:hypothetical protein